MDDRSEASTIADTIAKAGEDFYAKTAVFYRTNAQSRALEKALNDRRIPSVIFGGMRFWDRKEIKDVLAYLRLLANERDDAAYLRVINTPPRAIGKTTVENILERERNGVGTFWENLLAEAEGTGRAAPKLKGFTDLVLGWKSLLAAGDTPLPILAEKIIADTGYKDFLRKEDELTADERQFRGVRRLYMHTFRTGGLRRYGKCTVVDSTRSFRSINTIGFSSRSSAYRERTAIDSNSRCIVGIIDAICLRSSRSIYHCTRIHRCCSVCYVYTLCIRTSCRCGDSTAANSSCSIREHTA
jgi:hypothetical protein